MARSGDYVIALVTAPDLKVARKLAQAALKTRLAACVNILPKVESHYWWQGKLEKGSELLLVFKTTRAQTSRLQDIILKTHPYDTAEFIVLPIRSGNKRYLDWISASVAKLP
jgi:periplasmic divalent cation tolerance protein